MVEVEGGKNGEFALGQVVKGFIKRAKFSKGLLTSERDKMYMRVYFVLWQNHFHIVYCLFVNLSIYSFGQL